EGCGAMAVEGYTDRRPRGRGSERTQPFGNGYPRYALERAMDRVKYLAGAIVRCRLALASVVDQQPAREGLRRRLRAGRGRCGRSRRSLDRLTRRHASRQTARPGCLGGPNMAPPLELSEIRRSSRCLACPCAIWECRHRARSGEHETGSRRRIPEPRGTPPGALPTGGAWRAER